ncbi:MAG: guanylate kinase [Chlamydiales bacterium]
MWNDLNSKGKIFILSAPAGTGKTTLVNMLTEEYKHVVRSISYTSRAPRPEERNAVDYFFVSREEFEQKIRKGDFLEYVSLYGNYYGTDLQWIQSHLKEGHHVILVIDTQGALKLKGKIPAVFIFVKPPSLEELRRRIEERQTENQEMIRKRLDWAQKEIQASNQYDYIIVNDQLDKAFSVLKSIVIAEEHRNIREA